MKKTQWIYFFRRIRRSKISFIAILVFIMFGVGLYSGLKWYEPSLYKSMDADYNIQKFRDVELVFSAGLSDDGIEKLRSIPEVSEVEGTYTAYQYFLYDGLKYQAKIKMITNEIDLLRVKEGALPTAENEIAVDAYWAENNHLSVGDMIILDHDGDKNDHLLREMLYGEMPDPSFQNIDGMRYFKCDTFTVTALVYSPAELSMIASKYEPSPVHPALISTFFFAPRAAFDELAFPGYTGALIRSDALRTLSTKDKSYASSVDDFAGTLRPVAEKLCEDQSKRIHEAFETLRFFPSGADALPLSEPDSTVALFTRTSNPTVVLTGVIGEFGEKLCTNFGSVFLIIGILICYSTLSRLVYQETVLSGTQRALGFSDREITRSFMLNAVMLSVFGVALGALLSVFIVQPLLLKKISDSYFFTDIQITFVWQEMAVLFLLETAGLLSSAFLACYRSLHCSTLSMLSGGEPPSDKVHLIEKTRFSRKLPLLSKCTVKNLLNDHRRVIGTLIGIIGCTVLTVSAITFDLSVTGCMGKQFSKLQSFDTVVYFEPDNNEAADKIKDILSEMSLHYRKVGLYRITAVAPDGKNVPADLFVSRDGLEGVMKFYRLDGTPGLPGDGALLSCAFARQYGITAGKTLQLINTDMQEYTLPVNDVFEYYVQAPCIVLTAEAYERHIGNPLLENAFLVEKGALTIREFAERLDHIDGYIYTQDYYQSLMRSQYIVESLTHAVMIVYLVLSVLMAIFVILDIQQMFVTEKKRELITLLINGYSVKQAQKYISVDTACLSVVGILAGIVGGAALGAWDINNMESDVSYFLHGINPLSCIIGAAFTALLIVIMTVIALKRIREFHLSDISIV